MDICKTRLYRKGHSMSGLIYGKGDNMTLYDVFIYQEKKRV